jgi:hypothetical protein
MAAVLGVVLVGSYLSGNLLAVGLAFVLLAVCGGIIFFTNVIIRGLPDLYSQLENDESDPQNDSSSDLN